MDTPIELKKDPHPKTLAPQIPKEVLDQLLAKHTNERVRKDLVTLAASAMQAFGNFYNIKHTPDVIGKMAAEAAFAAYEMIEAALEPAPAPKVPA